MKTIGMCYLGEIDHTYMGVAETAAQQDACHSPTPITFVKVAGPQILWASDNSFLSGDAFITPYVEVVAYRGKEMALPHARGPDGHDIDGLADEGPGFT